MEGRLDVVGGTAVALAGLRVAALIDLGQGGLDEGGGAADDGDEPHPEHRAVAADADGHGHADDVAGPHAGGGGHHQGLEGGDGPGPVRPLGHHPQGLPEHPELDEAGAEGEIEPSGQQDDDEKIRVHEVADR